VEVGDVDYKELGKRIRAERTKLNLTQEKLAEKIEISESFLGHIERGDRKLSLETLVKIAQEFNVSTDYLLVGSVKQPPHLFVEETISVLEKVNKKQVKILLNIG
jgi:transcriptional regulator with XRE-family HTH domain